MPPYYLRKSHVFQLKYFAPCAFSHIVSYVNAYRKCWIYYDVIVMVTTITTHTNIANSVTHCKNYDEFSITASFKVKG